MLTADSTRPTVPLADLIPDSQTIYDRLARLDAEASLLRRLLSVALRRERESERLSREGVSA